MACNSVATTRVTVTQVKLTKDQLLALAAQLLSVNADNFETYVNQGGDYIECEVYQNGRTITLDQTTDTNGTRVRLSIRAYGDTGTLQAELDAKLEPLLLQAQQKAIMSRLQQLGKLSQVKGVDGGVKMRLSITV